MAINKRSEYSKAWQNKKIAKGLCGGCGKNKITYRDWETDRKSTRLNSSHSAKSRMPSSA